MQSMYSIIPQYHDFAGKYELVVVVIAVYVYVIGMSLIRKHTMSKLARDVQYMFCYCEGSRQKVVARDIVTRDMFEHYDELVQYPVLHIGGNCIYFVIE